MVENKAGIKDLNLKIKLETIEIFLTFIRKNWVNIEKQTVICDIAFLFVKHSAFWMKEIVTVNSSSLRRN